MTPGGNGVPPNGGATTPMRHTTMIAAGPPIPTHLRPARWIGESTGLFNPPITDHQEGNTSQTM